MLNDLQNILAADNRTLGTIIHIGAGKCSELETYTSLVADQIVLVEASLRIANILTKSARRYQNVDIRHNAVFQENVKRVEFNIYKNSHYNSVLPLEGEKVGENLLRSETVECISIVALLDDLLIDASKANLLVVETPGIEYQLLQSLSKEKLLKFRHIAVSITRPEIYQQGALYAELMPLMLENDFLPLLFREAHASFTEQIYRRDDVSISLRSANEEDKQKNDRLATVMQEKERANSQALFDYSKQIDELRAENTRLLVSMQELELSLAKSSSDNVQQEDLRSENTSLICKLRELEVANATAVSRNGQKVQELAAENTLLLSIVEELKVSNAKTVADSALQLDKIRAENNRLEDTLRDLELAISRSVSESDELHRERRLAQKLLAKSQVDLEGLRQKYSDLLERERTLIKLIEELGEKLRGASKYYFKLQNSHPELIADVPD